MNFEPASVRPLTTDDLDSVIRLHRFSNTQQGRVFGTSDLTEVVLAAAQRQSGAFGYVAYVTDPDEPEEEEVVGALTAQCSVDPVSSSATLTVSQEAEMMELVVLTLVVRADVRRQGVGAQLMAMLLQSAQQLAQQHGVTRIVADVALTNDQAWGFFLKAGFIQGQACDGTAEAVLLLAKPQQQSTGRDGVDGAATGGTTAAAAVQGRLQRPHLAASVACARPDQFCSDIRSQQHIVRRQWLPARQLQSPNCKQVLAGYKARCRSTATSVSLSHAPCTTKMRGALLA